MLDEIATFIDFLRNLPTTHAFQCGSALVVREGSSRCSAEEALGELSRQVGLQCTAYGPECEEETMLELLKADLAKGAWALLEVKRDPSARVIAFLKSLMQTSSVEAQGRLIAFAEREFIENGVSHPYFYGMFGWVCAI